MGAGGNGSGRLRGRGGMEWGPLDLVEVQRALEQCLLGSHTGLWTECHGLWAVLTSPPSSPPHAPLVLALQPCALFLLLQHAQPFLPQGLCIRHSRMPLPPELSMAPSFSSFRLLLHWPIPKGPLSDPHPFLHSYPTVTSAQPPPCLVLGGYFASHTLTGIKSL